MNIINNLFPVFVLVPQLLMGVNFPNTLAQQPQQDIRKEHLEYCVDELTVKVGEVEAIKGVMQQNLLPVQKLEEVSQILTPQQKQQLRACMQQPMPPQPKPPQG